MTNAEIKQRVEFRMKPLLIKGVRLIYGKSEFSVTDFDFFDKPPRYVIHASDRKEPFEFILTEMIQFLNTVKRKDGVAVPAFDEDATRIEPPAVKGGTSPQPSPKERETVKQEVKPGGKYVHIEATKKIYVTRDYGLFTHITGNRPLNKMKIKRIMDDIAAGTNMLAECPIVVSEDGAGKLKVIDGQHRLEVCKQLKSQVYYVIKTELTMYQIAKVNSNVEKWKGDDFINCYAAAGSESYKILKEFINVYNLPLNAALNLLNKGKKMDTSSGKDMDVFRQGRYMVKKEQEAIEVMKEVKRFSAFAGHTSGAFIMAICRIMANGKMHIDDIVKEYEKRPELLVHCKGWKEYLTNLEEIVNAGKSKRRVIW